MSDPGSEATATGTFEVDLKPLPLAGEDAPPLHGRMSLDKTFQGDLEATGRGEMLFARTATDGSAGYVAIEHVTGTLAGRSGTFVLQHSSTMDRGEPSQSVTVVPDSATGELEGLSGEMAIENDAGKHSYVLRYKLPPAE